jgi:hypothetical protein
MERGHFIDIEAPEKLAEMAMALLVSCSTTALEHHLCFVTRNVKNVVLTGAEVFNRWDNK